MYQKCPICNGTGFEFDSLPSMNSSRKKECTVCEGSKIISQITGRPPARKANENSSNTKSKGVWTPFNMPKEEFDKLFKEIRKN